MVRAPVKNRVGWLCIGLSLALHLFTIYAYARQPDILAAYTTAPIWFWGVLGIGLSAGAFLFLRAPLSLILTCIWSFTVLLAADEARAIANIAAAAPTPGTPARVEGIPPIRALTLNCAGFEHGDPAAAIARWKPDVVLLQEVSSYEVKHVADVLYNGRGDYRSYADNGIVTRWQIVREVRNPNAGFQHYHHNVTIERPDGRLFEVVNLHLSSAATNLRLWDPDCWREHRRKRLKRHRELALILEILHETAPHPGPRPVILGGDLNAPPNDPALALLAPHFSDAFRLVGTGWGNTFHRRVPLLRIDQLRVTSHFTPVRATAHTTRRSDHRMVIADLLLERSP